jgi:ATP-dependent exoDNAse (exonuclease V) beta subunit
MGKFISKPKVVELPSQILESVAETKSTKNLKFLAEKYPHERDEHISFEEGPHIYTVRGDSGYCSVTTFNHAHFDPFDADKVIANMMKSSKWPQNKLYGMTVSEIKALWDGNRDSAAAAGTKLHYDIECYFNECPNENDSIEYGYFKQFLDDFSELNMSKARALRTEWQIYHEELRIAGSIDMIFENEDDGTLQIYDWKRSKEIVKTNKYGKHGNKECIKHLPDTNYWHYCLQLNTYKAILEEKYGKKVTDMYLVCLHPDSGRGSYLREEVADLQAEVR